MFNRETRITPKVLNPAPPPPQHHSRFGELLDGLRQEYENLQHEFQQFASQHDGADQKRTAMDHLNIVKRMSVTVKMRYDEELDRIRSSVAKGDMRPLIGENAAAFFEIPPIPNLETELGLLESKRILDVSIVPHASVVRRSSTGTIKAKEEPNAPNPTAATTGPATQAAPAGTTGPSGFDWLVVYNPKVPRAISIDLVHTLAHDSVVCSVRFSRCGKLLAVGTNRACHIYDVVSGKRISELADPGAPTNGEDQYERAVAFSPDGRMLATGSEDRNVRLWDLESRTLKSVFIGHEQDVYCVEFTPDGSRLISGSGDRTVRIWQIETGTCLFVLSATAGPDCQKEAGITSLTISPDNKNIRIWELQNGKPVDSLEGHRDSVYSVAFNGTGSTLVSGSLDKTIKIWDFSYQEGLELPTIACRHTILGHKDFVLSVAISTDQRWVVSGSKDRTVHFWDLDAGTTQLMVQGHKNSVICVAMGAVEPDGRVLFATGSGDCRARIWSYTIVRSN